MAEILKQDGQESPEDMAIQANLNNNAKLSVRQMSKASSTVRKCDSQYALIAFFSVVLLSATLVVLWLLRKYTMDIVDGIFILSSISMIVSLELIC